MQDMNSVVNDLLNGDEVKSGAARKTLWQIQAAEVPKLIEVLKRELPEVRRAVAEEFWAVDPSAVPPLIAALNDESSAARLFAIEALGRLEFSATKAVPALTSLMSKSSGDEVRAAAVALERIEKAELEAEDAFSAAEVLARTRSLNRENVLRVLLGALRHPSHRSRPVAAETLRGTTPAELDALREIVSGLIAALDNDDEEVWYPASKALTNLGSAALLDLIGALKSDSEKSRWRAAKVLGEIGSPTANGALPHLIAALNDESSDVRYYVCRALGLFTPDAYSALVTGLRDRNEYVRASVACSLGNFGPEANPILLAALHDASAEVRYHAALSLGRIKPVASETVPALIALLSDREHVDENLRVCNAAANALEGVGPPHAVFAVPALMASFQHDDWAGHREFVRAAVKIGLEAIPSLMDCLRHQDWRVRVGAARTLGMFGYQATDAVPALAAALADERTEVVSQATSALRDIDPGWSTLQP
jgi:HEAT repeat protein